MIREISPNKLISKSWTRANHEISLHIQNFAICSPIWAYQSIWTDMDRSKCLVSQMTGTRKFPKVIHFHIWFHLFKIEIFQLQSAKQAWRISFY